MFILNLPIIICGRNCYWHCFCCDRFFFLPWRIKVIMLIVMVVMSFSKFIWGIIFFLLLLYSFLKFSLCWSIQRFFSDFNELLFALQLILFLISISYCATSWTDDGWWWWCQKIPFYRCLSPFTWITVWNNFHGNLTMRLSLLINFVQ